MREKHKPLDICEMERYFGILYNTQKYSLTLEDTIIYAFEQSILTNACRNNLPKPDSVNHSIIEKKTKKWDILVNSVMDMGRK